MNDHNSSLEQFPVLIQNWMLFHEISDPPALKHGLGCSCSCSMTVNRAVRFLESKA